MKIDIFTHISPPKYLKALQQKTSSKLKDSSPWISRNPALVNIDFRLKVLERYPGVLQVLTLGAPPVETVVGPADAAELARIANNELAELVSTYPDKFIAGVACLPLNDIDAALKEADRAVTQLSLKGVQIFTNINGETLDLPRFRPLFEKMARYDLPIWIHPWEQPNVPRLDPLNWPYETTLAMARLVFSGVLEDYPDIKFITHHCGAMVPFFDQRIKWLSSAFTFGERCKENALDYFHKFYCDTALYGSTPALMCGYAFFGADHILFGTDMPLGTTGISAHPAPTISYGLTQETIHSIERMDVPDTDKEKIFEQNALRLLKAGL